jgi:AraC family transcriptional regulator of adaptative response/methylated-DNA-[protein]-cysteine methyltransferase
MYLRVGKPVAEATYEAGYSSSSRVYEDIQSRLGMTPAVYRRQAAGMRVRYTICDSPIGKLLVAATDKGVCKIEVGESEERLRASVAGEFPRAIVERDDVELKGAVSQILRHLEGAEPELSLPLDIRATAFQLRVYNALRRIPYGATRSYGEVARSLRLPNGQRAVARACATNPVALAVPCHRVIAADGGLGGYRWGVERKRKLLEREAAARRESVAE